MRRLSSAKNKGVSSWRCWTLKRLFEDDEDDTTEAVCLAFTHKEIFALSINGWVTRSERWFITPLKESSPDE